jgi:hypothetical protein
MMSTGAHDAAWLAGARAGMAKTAATKDQRRRRLMTAGAVGVGAAGLVGLGILASRPAIRAHILDDIRSLGRGGGHAVDRARPLPAGAVQDAKAVADYLRAQGIDPAKARIAISGTGGTGKSTLSKGLSDQLGMQSLYLDDVGKSLSGRDLTKFVTHQNIKPGVIAEQTHLLNQVDPDKFDVLIRVHKPMDLVKQQILDRGRGAGQLEVYDYDKLHKSIHTAFHTTAGQSHSPLPHVEIKFKPQGGFNADNLLRQQASAHGVNMPAGAPRQDLVFAAAHGERPWGGPIMPYVRKGRMAGAAGVAGGAGMGAGGGTYLYANRQQQDQRRVRG